MELEIIILCEVTMRLVSSHLWMLDLNDMYVSFGVLIEVRKLGRIIWGGASKGVEREHNGIKGKGE